MPENNWYGHTFVLARYCGLKSLAPPIYGMLPHGWRPDYSPIVRPTFSHAPLLVWNERHAEAASAAGVEHIVRVGAPFVYASHSIAGNFEGTASGKGTLCMPLHSVSRRHSIQNHGQLIAEVEESEDGPFAVALFYVDMSRREVTDPYHRAGWRIVSFGRRDDNLFIYRVIAEMVRYRTVVSDHLSTATWYAAHLGKRVRVMGSPPAHPDLKESGLSVMSDRWPDIYGEGLEGEAAQMLANRELGASFALSPADLRNALGWSTWRQGAATTLRLAIDLRHDRAMRRGDAD